MLASPELLVAGNLDASLTRSVLLWKQNALTGILPPLRAHSLVRGTASDRHYAGSSTVTAAIGGLESGGPGKKDIRESG